MKDVCAIICGGRDFDESNYPGIRDKLIEILKNENVTEEVCGMAKGADMYGSEVAHSIGLKVIDFYADWYMRKAEFANEPKLVKFNRYGTQYNALAGINRNKRMADYTKWSGICIALPGGSGTQDMIRQSIKNNIPVYQWKTFDQNESKFELIFSGDKLNEK